jgi:hypothetical protein
VLKKQGRAGGILFRTIGAIVLVGAAVAGLAVWRHAGAPDRPTIDAAVAAPKTVHQHAALVVVPRAKPSDAPKATYTVIRAVRDRSWLSIRLGGPSGKEIFRGTLERGHFLKYGLGRAIWMRMGRPLALDIKIGKTLVGGLPDAPTNVVLTRTGATR